MANLPKLGRKPSGIYYLDLRSEGLGRVSLNTKDKATALDRRRGHVAGTAPLAPAEQSRSPGNHVTMRELFSRAEDTVWHHSQVKSQATVRSNIKILNSLIGDEPVTDMTYDRLERLVAELKSLGYAPATIKRKLDAVSKVLKMATKWHGPDGKAMLASKPTMPSIRVSNLKDREVSSVEEAQIFACIEARRQAEPGRNWRRFGALIRFLVDTGARLGEALGVGPDDLTVVQGPTGPATLVTFARYRTKNDKPRSVPLTYETRKALLRIEDDLGRDLDQKLIYFPISNGTAWYMWDGIRSDMKKLGFDIDDVTLHTLRHTCLSRLARGGMDLMRLQKWAGHSDPKITAERYVHLQPGDLIGGLDILQGLGGGAPANLIFTEAGAIHASDGTVSLQ